MRPLVGYQQLFRHGLVGESGALYDYILGESGLYACGLRPGLTALVPVALSAAPIVGLAPLGPVVCLTPRVPARLVADMIYHARAACLNGLSEQLYHLVPGPDWTLVIPAQVAGASSVQPLGPTAGTSYETALVDVHSHHILKGHGFSRTDSESETGLLRVFAVLEDIFEHPTLIARVNVFNHSWEFDPRQAFDLPEGVDTGYDRARSILPARA